MSIVISGGGGGGGGATTLNGLSDVNISGVANGQIIAYNNTSGNWENRTGISGGLTYKGSFNATTGAPSIANAVQGDFYVISVGGTIYGQTWVVGDHLLINADMGGVIDNAKIDKIDNTDQVTSVNGQTGAVTGLLEAGNNLSDLSNVPTARSNLSLGSAALANDTDGVTEGASNLYFTNARADARISAAGLLAAANNLNDVADAATARSNLSLGSAATANDTDGVAEGASNLYFTNARADARISAAGLLAAANNLSDVADAATARSNLSLGSAALANDTDGVTEGASNLYFTNTRADGRADTRIAASDLTALADVSYTAGPGIDNFVLTFDNATSSWGAEVVPSAPVASVNGATGTVVLDTDNVAEGSSNLYFTNARADARITAAGLLTSANNLSDVADAATARSNLNLGSAALAAATDFLSGTGADTLGGNLDVGSSSIVSSSNADIAISPNGTGQILLDGDGTTGNGGVSIENGLVDIKNSGSGPSEIRLYCESNNAHYVGLRSAPHSGGYTTHTLSLPNDVGSPGQTLTTDGNNPAQLSWTTAAGGTRPTVTTDNSGTDSTISNPAASVLEDIYLVDNGAAVVNITLPTVTSNSGYKVQIKRLGTANVTITPASGTIDGAANQVLSVQYSAFTCCTDGTNWHII